MNNVRKLSRTWEDRAAGGFSGAYMTLRQETMNAIFMLQCAARNAGIAIDTPNGKNHYEFLDCPWVLFYQRDDTTGLISDVKKVDALDLITGAGQLEFVHGVKETSGSSI